VLSGISIVGLLATQSDPVIHDNRDARQRLGQIARVCGRVIGARCKAPDRLTFLELNTRSSRGGLSVKIPNRDAFGPRLEDRYVLTNVCATGLVERQNDQYSVLATTPADLRTPDTPTPLAPSAVDVFRPCDDGVTPPVLRTPAPLPSRPRGANHGAELLLEGLVLPDGTIGDARVVYSSDPSAEFGDEATRAFNVWRWRPGSHNGVAVSVVVTMLVTIE
jgi:TonB family protein